MRTTNDTLFDTLDSLFSKVTPTKCQSTKTASLFRLKLLPQVTAYAAELEDLDLDKRRLVSLWNTVIVNITQRDRVYDSVRDDYR